MSKGKRCAHLHFRKMAMATVQNMDLGEDKTGAIDQERNGECGGGGGSREKGQDCVALRKNHQQNILTNKV